MSDPATFNVQAFQPYDGGVGVEYNATTSLGTAVAIPGTQGVEDKAKLRVLVVNDGPSSASIRMGAAGVQAATHCTRIQSGTSVLLTPPFVSPSGLWIDAICKFGTANLQITAGQGT